MLSIIKVVRGIVHYCRCHRNKRRVFFVALGSASSQHSPALCHDFSFWNKWCGHWALSLDLNVLDELTAAQRVAGCICECVKWWDSAEPVISEHWGWEKHCVDLFMPSTLFTVCVRPTFSTSICILMVIIWKQICFLIYCLGLSKVPLRLAMHCWCAELFFHRVLTRANRVFQGSAPSGAALLRRQRDRVNQGQSSSHRFHGGLGTSPLDDVFTAPWQHQFTFLLFPLYPLDYLDFPQGTSNDFCFDHIQHWLVSCSPVYALTHSRCSAHILAYFFFCISKWTHPQAFSFLKLGALLLRR